MVRATKKKIWWISTKDMSKSVLKGVHHFYGKTVEIVKINPTATNVAYPNTGGPRSLNDSDVFGLRDFCDSHPVGDVFVDVKAVKFVQILIALYKGSILFLVGQYSPHDEEAGVKGGVYILAGDSHEMTFIWPKSDHRVIEQIPSEMDQFHWIHSVR